MVICKNCGTDVPEGTEFCPTCGNRIASRSGFDRRRPWRHGGDMGYWGEWRSEDWERRWGWMWSPLWITVNLVILGLGIVFIGTLLFLAASGYMGLVSSSNFWAYLLIGLGGLGLIRETAKYLVSRRLHWPGGIILALILIILGVAGLVAQLTHWSQYWWTFVIAAAGLVIIVMGVFNYLWMRGKFNKQ
jgi:hypothetical protein